MNKSIFNLSFIVLLISFNAASGILWQGCHRSEPKDKSYFEHKILPYESPSQIQFSTDNRKLMQSRLDTFISMTLKAAPSTFECTYSDYPCNWMYFGSSGRALTFFKLYQNYILTNPTKAKEYLAEAKKYIDGALSRIKFDHEKYISFLNGNSGVYSIAAVIYDSLGYYYKAMEFVALVGQVFEKPLTNLIDYEEGIAGYLYSIEFIEAYFGQQLFDRNNVINYAKYLFEYGYNNRSPNGTLFYPNPQHNINSSIGIGVGTAGILRGLMNIPEIMSDSLMRKHIEITCDFLIQRQREDGQVVEIEVGLEENVQWCHGAPSAIPIFILAYQHFGEEKYLEAAEKAAEYTFQKGILVKGLGLCHGVSSNIYMINQLFRITKNLKYKYYMTEMNKFALNTALLTDPEKMEGWHCLGDYSAFHDTPAAAISIFSDFLINYDGDLGNMWMMGFEKPSMRLERSYETEQIQEGNTKKKFLN